MGRRPLNTTKSGKYMNPTDQARKLARKKELKKNKKQRQLIRLAVLKSKDPKQILYEMEALDEMEFNTDKIPIFREAVLQDKRRKLREMLERVLGLYEKEEPEYFQEIKKLKREYEARRVEKITYYESVKNAKNVNVDSIPLPENAGNLFSHDPANDMSHMYYSFTNHNMMLGMLGAGSAPNSYYHTPLLYNIPLPMNAGSSASAEPGSGLKSHENMGGGMDKASLESQQPLKSILKPSGGGAYGVERLRTGAPGPPMDPPPPLSPVRTEESDEVERRLSRELRRDRRDERTSRRSSSSGSDRSRNRSRRERSEERDRRKQRISKRSPSPDNKSSTGSSDASDSEKSGEDLHKKKEKGSDTEEEDYEEIIAEDKSYDDYQNSEQKSRKIRFNGPEEDSYEEKDSRGKYKQMAKEITNARKQSRYNDQGENRNDNYQEDYSYNDSMQHNYDSYADDPNMYQSQQAMNYAMMQNSMMMKGFPMMPMQNTYRPAINEPLLGPPPPPLFMQHRPSGGQSQHSLGPPSLGSSGSGLNLEDITLPSPGIPQIVGLPKLSYDRPAAIHTQQTYFSAKGSNAVIEAKPQIRSLTEESIKFMPTSLRIKRDAKAKKPGAAKPLGSSYTKLGDANMYGHPKSASNITAAMMNSQTKDDAYAAFMKEMEEIM